jgi:hypothetical protein
MIIRIAGIFGKKFAASWPLRLHAEGQRRIIALAEVVGHAYAQQATRN